MKNVKITPYIVSGSAGESSPIAPAINEEQLDGMVSKLNQIYRQVGVQFYLADIVELGYEYISYYSIGSSLESDELVSLFDNTGGLEVYFIGRSTYASAMHTMHEGIWVTCMDKSDDVIAVMLAHEIGHSGNLNDIYKYNAHGSMDNEKALIEYNVGDWPNVVGFKSDPSYFDRDSNGMYATSQRELVSRLLMHGMLEPPLAPGQYSIDIPLGGIFGLDAFGSYRTIDVGMMGIDRGAFMHD